MGPEPASGELPIISGGLLSFRCAFLSRACNGIGVLSLGWGFEGVETGTATEGFVKRGAEMAEAVVANFKRNLGDVMFATSQEFGGLFHAELSQVLRDGLAGLSGK